MIEVFNAYDKRMSLVFNTSYKLVYQELTLKKGLSNRWIQMFFETCINPSYGKGGGGKLPPPTLEHHLLFQSLKFTGVGDQIYNYS